jgi:hypothetical protein
LPRKAIKCRLVAPDIAIGEDQFDRTLGLRHAVEGGGARGIDREDGGGLALLLVAFDAEVGALDAHAVAPGCWRRRSGCQGAAARSVSMRLRRAPFFGLPRPGAGRAPAGEAGLLRDGTGTGFRLRLAQARFECCEQAFGERRLHGFEQHVGELLR